MLFSWEAGTGCLTQSRSCWFDTIHTFSIMSVPYQPRLHFETLTILLLLCPVQERVNHGDGRLARVDTRVRGLRNKYKGQMFSFIEIDLCSY